MTITIVKKRIVASILFTLSHSMQSKISSRNKIEICQSTWNSSTVCLRMSSTAVYRGIFLRYRNAGASPGARVPIPNPKSALSLTRAKESASFHQAGCYFYTAARLGRPIDRQPVGIYSAAPSKYSSVFSSAFLAAAATAAYRRQRAYICAYGSASRYIIGSVAHSQLRLFDSVIR